MPTKPTPSSPVLTADPLENYVKSFLRYERSCVKTFPDRKWNRNNIADIEYELDLDLRNFLFVIDKYDMNHDKKVDITEAEKSLREERSATYKDRADDALRMISDSQIERLWNYAKEKKKEVGVATGVITPVDVDWLRKEIPAGTVLDVNALENEMREIVRQLKIAVTEAAKADGDDKSLSSTEATEAVKIFDARYSFPTVKSPSVTTPAP